MFKEKPLVRLMKRNYKAGGVKVLRTDTALVLNGGYWCAMLPMEQVPGPVLGLLAEWLRRLPAPGKAFLCKKDGPEGGEVISPAEVPVPALRAAAGEAEDVDRFVGTKLVYDGDMLLQTGGGGVVWVPTEAADMVEPVTGGHLAADCAALWAVWIEPDVGLVLAVLCRSHVPQQLANAMQEVDFIHDLREGCC